MIRTILICLMILLGITSNLFAASDYNEIDRMFAEGNFKKVIDFTEAKIKKDPSDINAFYFGGRSYLRLNNYDMGINCLLQFEKLHDAIEIQQTKEIVKDKDQDYLLIDSYYSPAYYLLGEYYVKKSDFSKAERHLKRALSAYYDDRMLNFYMGLTDLELRKFNLAHKYFNRMIKLDPKEPSPYYNIAITYAQEGKPREAIEWLRDAIKRNPDYKKEAYLEKDFDPIRNSKDFQSLTSH